jgi:hypothetical protein
MSRLMASLDTPPSGRERPVWFDAADYGRAKLLAGAVPWSSPAELVAFFGKLQNMFRSDAILVELADLLAQRASGDEGLRTAMAARTRRPGYALRTLLADEQARATAVEAIRAVAATKGTVPVLLTVPAPGRWLERAARQALSDPGSPDPARAEVAAMYIADFLPIFAGMPVDGLIVDEGPTPYGGLTRVEAHRPVLNVAEIYGWPALVRTDSAVAWPYGTVPGVAAWLGSAASDKPNGRWGVVAGADFWDGAEPPRKAGIVLAAVPVDADPAAVMTRVRALA